VRRIRPPAVEERSVEGVGFTGAEDAAPVVGMDRGLVRGEEPGADPRAGGAEGEHGGEAATVSDSACGDDRNRRYGVDDPRHERERRNGSPDVTSGLPALRDDDVGSGCGGCPRLYRGADGDEHDRIGRTGLGNEISGVAPEEGDDAHLRRQRGGEPLALVPVQPEVDAERPLGLF
jgi:hypothetical protein